MTVLDAAQRGKIRRLSQPREIGPGDDEGGELNVVPFLDVVVNIMIFVLATVAVTFTASIHVKPPPMKGSHAAPGTEPTVFVVNEGFAIKTAGGNVAPGCAGVGPGIAVPKRGGQYDYAALTECARRLKHAGADGTQVFVTANPGTSYGILVSALDALRMAPGGELLFPDVSLRVPR